MNFLHAMDVVTKFANLTDMNWESVDSSKTHNSRTNLTMETTNDLAISNRTIELLEDFYAEHTSYYYDHVRQHGFFGCRPEIMLRSKRETGKFSCQYRHTLICTIIDS